MLHNIKKLIEKGNKIENKKNILNIEGKKNI